MSRLPRQVRLFGIVSLFNDCASEMVYPLLPAFVTGVLGAGPAALGALDGASDLAAAGVKLGSGRLADRPRARGPLVVLGYLVAVAVRPLIGTVGAAWQVVGLRVADRLGKGVRTPPRDALIADATPAALHGRAFALQRGLDHVGAILGPLVAWGLLASGTLDVRGVIRASIVPGVIVVALAAWAVKVGGGSGRVGEEASSPALTRLHPPSPVLPLLPIAAFHLVRFPETLLILHAQDLGVPVPSVTLLWAALHVVRSGSSFVGGALADRAGAWRALRLGWAVYAGLAAAFALALGARQAWVVFLAMGLVAGLTESPERVLVARLAGARAGSGFGVYHALTGLAALTGSLALGVIYGRAGGARALALSAASALALVILAGVVSKAMAGAGPGAREA